MSQKLKNGRKRLTTNSFSSLRGSNVPILLGINENYLEATKPEKVPDFNTIVTLNVCGFRYQTFEETLKRYPETLLGDPFRRAHYFNPTKNEYFFDRHRASFECILYFYQSHGHLKRPNSVPVDIFLTELKFFQMSPQIMQKFWIGEGYIKPEEDVLPENPFQRCIWLLVEHPDSGKAAQILAFVTIFVILVSTVSFCLETIPELKAYFRTHRKFSHNITSFPSHSRSNDQSSINEILEEAEASEEVEDKFDMSNPFFVIEFLCMCWFTIELSLRFISCPRKWEFCKKFLNIIDFVAIAPFFINLALTIGSTDSGHSQSNPSNTGASSAMSFSVLRLFRLVRVFRVFKLSRHSRGLQVLGKTFKASVQELMLLVFFMLIGLVLFSSGMYFAESGLKDSKFESIPAAFWFTIVSMTTVGYGDLVPIGLYGKLVGSMCAIVGVLVLALPVPVIVANFKHFYRQEARLVHMRELKTNEEKGIRQDVDDVSDDDSHST